MGETFMVSHCRRLSLILGIEYNTTAVPGQILTHRCATSFTLTVPWPAILKL